MHDSLIWQDLSTNLEVRGCKYFVALFLSIHRLKRSSLKSWSLTKGQTAVNLPVRCLDSHSHSGTTKLFILDSECRLQHPGKKKEHSKPHFYILHNMGAVKGFLKIIKAFIHIVIQIIFKPVDSFSSTEQSFQSTPKENFTIRKLS